MGGAVAAVESGYLKSALVASHAARRQRIESGADVVVGLNQFTTSEPNPLTADLTAASRPSTRTSSGTRSTPVQAWRAARDADPVARERSTRRWRR